MLGEGPTDDISCSICIAQKKSSLVLLLVKQRQNFCWVCITMVINVVC